MRTLLPLVALSFAFSVCTDKGPSPKHPFNDAEGVAIRGYDPVSYFENGKPELGRSEFSFRWMDSSWHFTSSSHRDLFAQDPDKYAPQFGGYCAYAVSQNYVYDADPDLWEIVDGKLYLNYNSEAQTEWKKAIVENIAKGRENWARLLEQ